MEQNPHRPQVTHRDGRRRPPNRPRRAANQATSYIGRKFHGTKPQPAARGPHANLPAAQDSPRTTPRVGGRWWRRRRRGRGIWAYQAPPGRRRLGAPSPDPLGFDAWGVGEHETLAPLHFSLSPSPHPLSPVLAVVMSLDGERQPGNRGWRRKTKRGRDERDACLSSPLGPLHRHHRPACPHPVGPAAFPPLSLLLSTTTPPRHHLTPPHTAAHALTIHTHTDSWATDLAKPTCRRLSRWRGSVWLGGWWSSGWPSAVQGGAARTRCGALPRSTSTRFDRPAPAPRYRRAGPTPLPSMTPCVCGWGWARGEESGICLIGWGGGSSGGGAGVAVGGGTAGTPCGARGGARRSRWDGTSASRPAGVVG
jgi:hypothetical protein